MHPAASPRARRRRLPWWSWLGVAVLAVGAWALARDVELWNTLWYLHAWYGYLLLLDGLLLVRTGRSRLAYRPGRTAAMMLWSVPFWYLYEAYNLRLANWYYVFAHHPLWLQALFSLLAFATVFPACFVHAELIRSFGWFETVRWRRWTMGPGITAAWIGLGLASIVLPLVWPRVTFPLVWGATLWLPDLLNRRLGAPSILSMLERGRPAPLLQLLVGGMAAGLAWEAFNWPARCRWIYTVPGFEEWKLFEMPVPGFFGFPVFAVAAFTFSISVAALLRGGRDWTGLVNWAEAWQRRRGRPAVEALVLLSGLLASGTVLLEVRENPVHSRRPLLVELDALGVDEIERLDRSGIPTPERLVRAVRAEGLEAVGAAAAIGLADLERAHRQSLLAVHKGMGVHHARLLLDVGIVDPSQLVGQHADDLHGRLCEVAEERSLAAPTLPTVQVWIRAASPDGRPRR